MEESVVSGRALLLSLLADGNIHSGEVLGEALGVSRAAVWKQLKKLEDLGLEVVSIKGHGYQIPGGLDLLDKREVEAGLSDEARRNLGVLEIHDQLGSTNSYLMEKFATQSIHGVVCLAEQQTAGRGRRGRSWQSPFGCNLYLSLGWKVDGGIAALDGLSLAVGVSVCRALSVATGDDLFRLKWPNDLLYQGRKLGGILVEIQGDPLGECHVVIGVGLNMRMRSSAVEIDQPWADLDEIGAFGRNQLAIAVISGLLEDLPVFTKEGFTAFMGAWRSLDAVEGKKIVLITPSSRITGIGRGVDSDGAVRLEIDGAVRSFHGGEVSLRVANDS